jgi:molybdate transport system substrate-binding protein
MIKASIAAIAVLLSASVTPTLLSAAEIKLLAAGALGQVLRELVPKFEGDTGHRVSLIYGPIGALTDRLIKGEAADVAIVSDRQVDELQGSGRILVGTRVDIARTGVGVFVRKDSPKPDIGSVDAFRRTLLSATAVTYADPASGGAAGIYVAGLMERMGISAEMNRRTKFDPRGGLLMYQLVASGEATIGFDQISIILTQPTVELVGPLPETIQNYTTFAAGIVATSHQAETAQDFIKFLVSPSAQERMKARGLQLGKS